MNIRLKFAFARGARIECDKGLDSVPQWESCAAPHWGPPYNWRVHPEDQHLQYGLLSTSLLQHGIWQGNALAAESMWVASTVFDDLSLVPHQAQKEDDRRFYALFLAELLADEGL